MAEFLRIMTSSERVPLGGYWSCAAPRLLVCLTIRLAVRRRWHRPRPLKDVVRGAGEVKCANG